MGVGGPRALWNELFVPMQFCRDPVETSRKVSRVKMSILYICNRYCISYTQLMLAQQYWTACCTKCSFHRKTNPSYINTLHHYTTTLNSTFMCKWFLCVYKKLIFTYHEFTPNRTVPNAYLMSIVTVWREFYSLRTKYSPLILFRITVQNAHWWEFCTVPSFYY